MKLEVGMYVRTELGIAKYLGIYEDTNMHEFDKLDEDLQSSDLYNVVFDCELNNLILKASYDIVNLIEPGDYVNGKKVIILKSNIPEGLDLDANDEEDVLYTDCYNGIWYGYSKEEIKTIVTHEQFEKLSYKIGE